MRKIGRNEPCPCGSGKKYKKCCGSSQIQQYDDNTINAQLYEVHGELISNVTTKLDEKIDKQITKYEYEFLKDEQSRAVFKTGLTPWIVMHIPLLGKGQTIFQAYLDEKRPAIALPTRQTLLKWMEAKPSIYEVLSIDGVKKGFAQISDISTGQNHNIPYQHASDFVQGGLLIGIVVPFHGHDNFLFTMLKLFHRDKEHFQKLLQENKSEKYPNLLAKALQDGLFNDQWLHPLHEEVADLFASHLAERNVPDNIIVDGIMLWEKYCQKVNPAIQKIEPHAAAFTYYIEKDLLNHPQVKQLEVADQFGTSPSTLSTIYRRIVQELNDQAK